MGREGLLHYWFTVNVFINWFISACLFVLLIKLCQYLRRLLFVICLSLILAGVESIQLCFSLFELRQAKVEKAPTQIHHLLLKSKIRSRYLSKN